MVCVSVRTGELFCEVASNAPQQNEAAL